ncbi:MAG: hypothetical protein ABI760_01895 [Ferruginibacter sp.]
MTYPIFCYCKSRHLGGYPGGATKKQRDGKEQKSILGCTRKK